MFDLTIYSDVCKSVVIELLKDKKICIENNKINEITNEILNITYSIGGSFEEALLKTVAETFLFKKRGIDKYLKN